MSNTHFRAFAQELRQAATDTMDPTERRVLRKMANVADAVARGVTSESPAKGHRLPEGWAPSPEVWLGAAGTYGEPFCVAELEKFIDYWRAADGPNAKKRDWDATFRNWLRRAKGYRNEPRGNGAGSPDHIWQDL